MSALRSLDATALLGFFSFEFYPFEEFCTSGAAKLAAEPQLLDSLATRLRGDGVPASVPLVISEYGLSACSRVMEVEPVSALFTAQTAVEWLEHGGAATYLFGFAPNRPMRGEMPCAGRGNMMLWLADRRDKARWRLPAYYGWRLLTREWALAGDAPYKLFPSKSSGPVTAYPLRRPDGRLSVLLLNRSEAPVAIRLAKLGRTRSAPEVLEYGAERFHWSVDRERPVITLPPHRERLCSWTAPLTLPAMTMAVLR